MSLLFLVIALKYKIADLIVEMTPKFNNTLELAEPFLYDGDKPADLTLKVSDEYLSDLMSRAAEGSTVDVMENFAFSCAFNRAAINYGTMLIHSSALIYGGGAYLFSANSGVGKSTHTKLWLKAFGDKVHIMNDDKPVVKLLDDKATAYGTPFDGGSGIALNEAYPLKAIIFIERGEENSVRVPETKEIIQRLYFQTAHMVGARTAENMLENFEKLISLTKFFVLTCNTDISAAHTAFDNIIGKNQLAQFRPVSRERNARSLVAR